MVHGNLARVVLGGAALLLGAMETAAMDQGKTRYYYIAAEDVAWDFAPSNQDLVRCPAGCPLPERWTNSHVFAKTRYVEYTDASFMDVKPQPDWLGILGPIIRAEEGDSVKVLFCNNSAKGRFGMHPHGLRPDKDSSHGAQVAPGNCFAYSWHADPDSAPAVGELSSKVWWYRSHADEPAETNMGLLGPIIVTRKGMARPDGSPRDVDKEFVTAFLTFDEMSGADSGMMHSINGYIFGNLNGLVMRNGDKVRWHAIGMGNEVDSPRRSVGTAARRGAVAELMPAGMATADMTADNPGEWVFHDNVAGHFHAGMMVSYRILP